MVNVFLHIVRTKSFLSNIKIQVKQDKRGVVCILCIENILIEDLEYKKKMSQNMNFYSNVIF